VCGGGDGCSRKHIGERRARRIFPLSNSPPLPFQPQAAATSETGTAPRPPRSINYEPKSDPAGSDADFEAALRASGFDKAHPEADIPAIVAAEEAWAAPPPPVVPAPAAAEKKNPNATCLLNCNGETLISFDALAPPSAAAWDASGVAWDSSRGGLAFLPRPSFGFTRTRTRVCFPNVTTSAGDACFPIGSAGYAVDPAGHVALAAYTGPTPTVTLAGGVRNFKSAWVVNPAGPLAFRGFNLAGRLKCSGTIPASPGASLDLAGAGCCSVGLLTVGFQSGLTPAGVPFALGDVRLCKATP
jgi:hypothetical protein